MIYIGPGDDEGIRIYRDGQKVAADKEKTSTSKPAGDGMIVAGRRFTNLNGYYASVSLDEVLFFNSILNEEDVNAIYRLV